MALDAYDVWVFDLDGTVVDVDWAYTREVFDRVGDRLGQTFTDEEAHLLWHGLGGSRDDQLRLWGYDPKSFWDVFHDVEDPMARAEATYLHPDAERLIREIDAPKAILTHSQEFLATPVLSRLDIADWFDTVVCCTDELGWKPDPEPVRYTLDALGALDAADTGRVILAGDSPSDVGAAWNTGLDAIHVERHGHEKRGRCVLADYMVTSFDEIPRSPMMEAISQFSRPAVDYGFDDRTQASD